MPSRFTIARAICGPLPPLVAQRVRLVLYPPALASREARDVTVPARTGSPFRCNTADFHGYPFAVHGYYEWRHWAIARAVCATGDTIVEIGANVGTETIGFSDIIGRSGRVFAFEPLPQNVEVLRNALARCRNGNVTVLALAAGADCRTVHFRPPPRRAASGVGYVVTGAGPGSPADIEVECVSLDSMADELGRVRLLAIDAEGAEVTILQGAPRLIRENRPAILLEASPTLLIRAGFRVSALHESLTEQGYAVFRIERWNLRELTAAQAGRQARPSNWLALHQTAADRAPRVRRALRECGLLPFVAGLNPLSSGGPPEP